MNDKEKLEAISKIVDRYTFQDLEDLEYSCDNITGATKNIKKILESKS